MNPGAGLRVVLQHLESAVATGPELRAVAGLHGDLDDVVSGRETVEVSRGMLQPTGANSVQELTGQIPDAACRPGYPARDYACGVNIRFTSCKGTICAITRQGVHGRRASSH